MPGKSRFTPKQDRMAKHIMQSEEKRGMSPKEAKQVAYATVQAYKNKKKAKKRG